MEEKEPARRVRTVLSLECGVCSAPAPDHLHFGGKHKHQPLYHASDVTLKELSQSEVIHLFFLPTALDNIVSSKGALDIHYSMNIYSPKA